MKTCKKCNIEKEVGAFHKAANYKDGLFPKCIECKMGKVPHKPILTGLKICVKCNESKDVSCFSDLKVKNKTYKHSICKMCKNKHRGIKRAENPDTEKLRQKVMISKRDPVKKYIVKRTYRLKLKYNMTLEDYNNLYAKQQGCCKICISPFELLNIDHCHSTGTIRGLLCPKCNTALGSFKDSVANLQRAILYLKDTNTDKP